MKVLFNGHIKRQNTDVKGFNSLITMIVTDIVP